MKLLDFGLAKLTQPQTDPDATQVMGETQPGMILGTPQYMSPEQVEAKEADARSDIFSFGAILYEMISGNKAFAGTTAAMVMSAVMRETPPSIEPPALNRIVKRCLEKDPDNRFQNARDVKHALEDLQVTEPLTSQSTSSRKWMLATAVLSLALGAAGIAVLSLRQTLAPANVVTFSLEPPENLAFIDLAISPDGKRIAFTTRDSSNRTHLWVRPIDSLIAQRLEGTEFATGPFWSADSRLIAFFAGKILKRIEYSGGNLRNICDTSGGGQGGTWNQDGVILFKGALFQGISRVSAEGGDAKPATIFEPTSQANHHSPSFLPDGRQFVYTVRGKDRNSDGIYLGTLDSRESVRLSGDRESAKFIRTPSGAAFLLFQREGSLLVSSFDTAGLKLTGETITVAEQAGARRPGPMVVSVSDTGDLLYKYPDLLPDNQLTWFDRKGNRQGVAGPPGRYGKASLSPDEKHLVVAHVDPKSNFADLWSMELARGVFTRVTFHSKDEHNPLWSPDGRSIFFNSNRDGPFNIYRKSVADGKEELVLKLSSDSGPHSFSPEGRYLTYSEQNLKTKGDLYVLPLFGDRKPIPFSTTEFDEFWGSFSPDGKWIAYDTDESGRREVFVQPFPATGAKWQVSTNGGVIPMWRGDGRELFYINDEQILMAVSVKPAAVFEPGKPTPLFESAANSTQRYAVTGDGQRFLIATPVEEARSQSATVVVNWAASIKK